MFLGKENFKKLRQIKRKLMGLKIEAKTISLTNWLPTDDQNNEIDNNICCTSPKFKNIVGIAMIKKELQGRWKKKNKINTNLAKGEVCNFPIK